MSLGYCILSLCVTFGVLPILILICLGEFVIILMIGALCRQQFDANRRLQQENFSLQMELEQLKNRNRTYNAESGGSLLLPVLMVLGAIFLVIQYVV